MAKRKKEGEPEMLIVSFCDIVTITTAAMFFAMLITVQESVKVPVIRPLLLPSIRRRIGVSENADALWLGMIDLTILSGVASVLGLYERKTSITHSASSSCSWRS